MHMYNVCVMLVLIILKYQWFHENDFFSVQSFKWRLSIYLTDSSQVAKGTVFRKHTVLNLLIHIKMRSREMFKFSWYENLLKNSESYLSSFTKNAIIYYYYLLEYF